ncbi:hypothetical protein OG978_13235 [Streptomyces sp. NBC_01591]|uniref:hypothetical protein n=1 Tax=Streptomyces sp. NBC_01591 TaxID=2975888 RepID=UPI002DDA9594|nr:hypothetical protein [Streptomyces sp. NBC_01591]WSD68283.1 hypothetical protein OG978_13235 [Streptomyces sp. NBC_01591]
MSYGYPPPQPGQEPQPGQQPPSSSPYEHWPHPAPTAYGYPQPPKKSRTGLIVTLSVVGGVAVLLALGVLIAVTSGGDSSSAKSKPSAVEATEGGSPAASGAPEPGEASDAPTELPALEGTDAEGDVRITRCQVDSLTEWPDADVEIVNHSDTQASYIVSVEFVDGDGTRRASGLATATDLAAGQKSVQKAQGLGKVPGKMTCKVSKVTRLPSS